MPNPFYHRAVVDRLVRLSDRPNPGYVRLAAVIKLIKATLPGSAGSQLLREAHPYEYARHKLRDLHDRPESVLTTQSRVALADGPDEEETPEEAEDPW